MIFAGKRKMFTMIKLNIANRLLKRTRRKLILFVVFIIFGLSILKFDLLPSLWGQPDISCYNENRNNSIEVLKYSTSLPTRSIFFLDTSCERNLTSRQSCAIESAARAHLDWQINIIHLGVFSDTKAYPQLIRIPNVKFWRVYIEDFTKGTPLEQVVQSGVLKKCRFPVERTLDVLKYLILFRWGGIFIDLDMIVGMPLGSLARNWAARENDVEIADRVLAFSKDKVGRNIAEDAVRDIQSNYKNSGWCNNPGTLARVLQNFCSTTEPSYMSSATCNGFEVYGQQFFYPLPKERARDYFSARELGIYNAYTYHFWREDTQKFRIDIGSPYFKLARRYCPTTYQLYAHYFGFY